MLKCVRLKFKVFDILIQFGGCWLEMFGVGFDYGWVWQSSECTIITQHRIKIINSNGLICFWWKTLVHNRLHDDSLKLNLVFDVNQAFKNFYVCIS